MKKRESGPAPALRQGGPGRKTAAPTPILVEPGYGRSIWCRNLLDGLTRELKQKRIPFRRLDGLDQLTPGTRYIYLIGSDNTWVRGALAACNGAGVYPILLCNQAYHTFKADYSTICSDVNDSMRQLVELLRGRGCSRIALYGVNPQSVADESRMNAYLAACSALQAEERGSRRDVFYNNGSLENCFEIFARRAGEYDAVICANDFAAVSLVRRIDAQRPELRGKLTISGCADARLTGLYSERILSVCVNFAEYGRAAVMLLENLRKNPYLSHIVMMIRWDFGGLEGPRPPPPASAELPGLPLPPGDDMFYADEELSDMMRIEALLGECGPLDLQLLRLLLQGVAYERISEQCFLTESTVKYRVKKMVDTCGVRSRAQMCALLKQYLPEGFY